MHITAQQQNGVCTLQMEGELTIYHGVEIRNGLIGYLDANEEIELNLSGITEMDTAGFQLLLAAKHEGTRQGKVVRFVHHSQAALELIDLYNMAAQFGDPLLIPARQ